MPRILKPGDPDFESMRNDLKGELREIQGSEEIMQIQPSAGTDITLEVRDFPDFQLHFGIVPMGDFEDQIVFHFKKLSRIKMRKLNEYLPMSIYNFFDGVNPAEHIKAGESPFGEEFLEYRSQYDMVFYRVKTMNSRNVMNAVLKIIEAFPG